MTDPASAAQAPPKRRRVFLILSLCLNVALVAMIVAGIVTAQWRKGMMPGGPLVPQALMKDATADEQDKIQAIMESHAVRVGQLRRAAAQARKEVFRVFASPNFSQSDLQIALEKMRAADTALEEEVTKVIAESAAQLSPAERARVAERVNKRGAPWWRRPMRRLTP